MQQEEPVVSYNVDGDEPQLLIGTLDDGLTHTASAGPPCQFQTLWQAKPSPSAKSQWELSAKTPGVKQTQLISASKPPPQFRENVTS